MTWLTNAERVLLGFLVAGFTALGTNVPEARVTSLYAVAAIALFALTIGRPPTPRR